jgi:hypothetical protein
MYAYVYEAEQKPEEAFAWCLSPCGGDDLVPEDAKKVFDILNTAEEGISSFKKPKKIKKGSGKKGDQSNPNDRSIPRQGSGVNSGKGGKSAKDGKKPKCSIKAGNEWKRKGPSLNTLESRGCDRQDKTTTHEWVVTSITYGPTPTAIAVHCSEQWSQACYHYSSVIRVNPQWATLTRPDAAATTAHRGTAINVNNGPIATKVFKSQHTGANWLLKSTNGGPDCNIDEYPPAYLIDPRDDAWRFSGIDARGQLVRHLDSFSNKGAASAWRSVCFKPLLQDMSNNDFRAAVERDPTARPFSTNGKTTKRMGSISVKQRPSFYWGTWAHAANPPPNDGLDSNPCWNKKDAPEDPGQVLLTYVPYYGGKAPPYDYTKPV